MTTVTAGQVSQALDFADQLIAAVRDEQWAGPTPAAPQGTVIPDAGLLNAYRDSAAELLSALREPGVLDAMVTVPFGTVPGVVALHLRITELLVHGWDLARATGQPVTVPDGLAEQERPRRTRTGL